MTWTGKRLLPVIVHDGIEPVSNGDDGAFFKLVANGCLYEVVGLHVHGGSRLVQHQDPCLSQQCPSKTGQLALPNTERTIGKKKNYCETSASLKVHLAEKMWNSCSTNVCSAATRKLTALLRCLFTTVWHKKETLPNGIAWAYLSGAILPSKAKPARVVAKQHRLGLETALFGERAAGP